MAARIRLPALRVRSLPEGTADGAWLVVLTQSCSVVSPRWDVDPLVGLAVATPAPPPFREGDPNARGKNLRKLTIPFKGDGFDALVVDFNSRFFVPREALFGAEIPLGAQVPETASSVGQWMGRIYSRAAMPNRLVELLAPVRAKLERGLKKSADGLRTHERIASVFVNFEPDDETGPYSIRYLVICPEDWVQHVIDTLLDGYRIQNDIALVEVDGVKAQIRVDAAEAVSLAELEQNVRLPEWDHFSGLGDEALQPET